MSPKPMTTTTLMLRVVGALVTLLAASGVGFAMRPMVAEEDANTRVSIGVLQSTQDTLVIDVKEHHNEIDALQEGIGLMNYKQEEAVVVHKRIEGKIDEILKSR